MRKQATDLTNAPTCVTVQIEYTDLFNGDANYSWCRRERLVLPQGISDRAVKALAKGAVGLTGAQGEWSDYGDTLEFRPKCDATVLFVNFYY